MIPGRGITWLASYPKSGNTWFRVFLSNLLLKDRERPVHINEAKLSGHAASRHGLESALGFEISDCYPSEIYDLRRRYYDWLGNTGSGQILKIHDAFLQPGTDKPVVTRESTHRVVYIVRNPLDVAVSFAFHVGREDAANSGDLVSNENQYIFTRKRGPRGQVGQFLGCWSDHVQGWLNSGLPLTLVRYEDLIRDDVAEFYRVIRSLGFSCSREEVEKAAQDSRFSRLKEMEERDGFVEVIVGRNPFFRKGRVGDWKNHLTMEQAREILDANVSVLDRLGYLQHQEWSIYGEDSQRAKLLPKE